MVMCDFTDLDAHAWVEVNVFLLFTFADTKTTQWQDPRTIEQYYQLPSLDSPTLCPTYTETQGD